MNSKKKLASSLAVALAVGTLSAASAFAEERHRDATNRDRRDDVRSERRDDDANRSLNRDTRMEQQRAEAMHERSRNESQSYRNGSRGNDNRGYNNNSRGRSIFSEGRVTRVERGRGGYRVWLDRGGYSYFVPEARWRLFPLRVGLSIRLGGYYDPLGYVYADQIGPYGGGSFYTAGGLHGVVASVDYRRATMVVLDDISGSFVTVAMRGSDRDFGYLHSGDYVELSGDWTRGIFEAYRVDDVRGTQEGRY
jgi:hypothetical protein